MVRPLLVLPVLMLLFSTAPLVAADSPTSDEVRRAVTRSLPFLEKEGLAWMKERACISCHQVPGMIWSLGEARRHRLAVDPEKLAAWNAWTLDNGLRKGLYYKLTDAAFAALVKTGVADDDVKKLASLKDKNYVFEADFRAAVSEQWPKDVAETHFAAASKAAGSGGQGAAAAARTISTSLY